MSTYRFKAPSARPLFVPKPEGDYDFTVIDCSPPYASAAGNLVLPVKLAIQPDGMPVFANPWTGTDRNNEERDGIAEFLLAVNRAPKEGQEPAWGAIVGARGRCRLKLERASKGALAGQEVNKVAFFHVPKQVGPSVVPAPAAAPEPQPKEIANDPDDIPF